MLKGILTNYFGFNKQQRNGLLVLVCISTLLFLVRIIYPYFIQPDPIVVKNLPLLVAETQSRSKAYAHKNSTHNKGELFEFDPNTISQEQLLKLGLKEKTAETFIKFRSRGFVFRKKEDLKKIYGISDKFYARLEPYILIHSKTEIKKEREPAVENKNQVPSAQTENVLELNTADSTALTALNGIGAGYSRRILKYRSALGGFVNKEQLKEVYGFPPELYEKLKDQVRVDASLVNKLDLNKDDFKIINKHPYLSYEHTKLICDWRRKTIITKDNLAEILKDPELAVKMAPYLAFPQ